MDRIEVWVLLAINVVTFLVFGWDKALARKGARRTPEARLLLFSFLGGFPAGWLGMSVFRHKTRKGSFRFRMVLVSLLNPLWLYLYIRLG